MRAVMDDLGLTDLVTTIAGLTVIGAAAILAETGDPARFATARALDWHAGLCPRDNASGAAQGKTSISGRGRPGLRLAAWRAVWAAMPNNPVMAARFAHLTTRWDNRLARQIARTACTAALLRWTHVVVTARSPGIRRSPPASARHAGPGDHGPSELVPRATRRRVKDPGGASPDVPRGTHLAHEHGQPRPSSQQARFTLSGNKPA
jgi:hypothetical protein